MYIRKQATRQRRPMEAAIFYMRSVKLNDWHFRDDFTIEERVVKAGTRH